MTGSPKLFVTNKDNNMTAFKVDFANQIMLNQMSTMTLCTTISEADDYYRLAQCLMAYFSDSSLLHYIAITS